MDPHVLRILDANFNRAREALRVLEEHARMILSDEGLSLRAKTLRHDLAALAGRLTPAAVLDSRDVSGDVGTRLSTPDESLRAGPADVARAAAARAAESLRCIEEYGKIIDVNLAARTERLRYDLYMLEQDVLLGGPRRARLRAARLHVLITESLCAGPWERVARAALQGGADAMQLREKSLSDRELLSRARLLREMTHEHDAMLIINDRPDIARLADADGVHVGATDLGVRDARSVVGGQRIVGATAHSVQEAAQAFRDDPDYVAVGTMFPSTTKPGVKVQGPALCHDVLALGRETTFLNPVVAIGGISCDNLAQLMPIAESPGNADPCSRANLQIAVCQSIISASDVCASTRALKEMLLRLQPVPA